MKLFSERGIVSNECMRLSIREVNANNCSSDGGRRANKKVTCVCRLGSSIDVTIGAENADPNSDCVGVTEDSIRKWTVPVELRWGQTAGN